MTAPNFDALTGAELIDHLRAGFRLMASGMYPDWPPEDFGGIQHRDMVRLFLAGAMMSRPPDPSLDALIEAITATGWKPPAPWNWRHPAAEEARANAANAAAHRRRRRRAGR